MAIVDPGAVSAIIAEYSRSPGLGAYVLAGAIPSFFPFSKSYASGTLIKYTASDSSYTEVVIGTLNLATGTLSRTTFILSNTGAFIDWPLVGQRIIRPIAGGTGPIVPDDDTADMQDVYAGTTWNVILAKVVTQVVWRSVVASPMLTTIPASGAGNNGYSLDIKTTENSGQTMTVTPASGTIGGLSSWTFLDGSVGGCNMFLRSDGVNTDWVIRCICCFDGPILPPAGDAVYFDGLRASLYSLALSGVSDGPLLTFSYWIQRDNPDYNTINFNYWGIVTPDLSNPGFYFTDSSAHEVDELILRDTGGTKEVQVLGIRPPASSGFVNILGSIDSSTNPVTVHLFRGETETTTTDTSSAGPFDMKFSGQGFVIPNVETPINSDRVDAHRMNIGDFWYAPGVYLDFTNPANRAKFHNVASGNTNPVSVILSTATMSLTPASFDNGIVSSYTLVCSFWIDQFTGGIGFSSSTNNFEIKVDGSNVIGFFHDATMTNFFEFSFPYTVSDLTNVRFAVDLDHPIASKIVLAYVGTANVTGSVSILEDDAANLLAFYDDTPMTFAFANGPVGDFWMAPDQFFDPGPKFVDGGGAPVNLGANGELPSGTSPTVYFHVPTAGAVSDFFTNLGTGGAFTIDTPLVPTLNAVDVITPISLGANGEIPTGTAPAVFFSGGKADFPTNRGTGGAFLTTGTIEDSLIGLQVTLPAPAITRGGIRLNGNGEMAAQGFDVTDTTLCTFSFFLRMASLPGSTVIIQSISAGPFSFDECSIHLNSSGNLIVSLGNVGGTLTLVHTQTSQTIPADSSYHHIAISVNSASGAFQLYVDRVAATHSTAGAPGFTIDFSALTPTLFWRWFGADLGTGGYIGDIAEFWIDLTQAVDFSVSSNLDKFVTAGLRSVDLGSKGETPTGSPPTYYFSQRPQTYAAPTFFTNRAATQELFSNDFSATDIDFVTIAPAPYP